MSERFNSEDANSEAANPGHANPGETSVAAGLVTVIIRTRDRLELLQRAVASVAEQQYRAIEVVVVNDGTLDVSASCELAAKGRLPLRIVASPKPGGRSRAANTGLQQARGEFLIFLDDDDWFYPDHLSKLVTALQHAPEYGLAYTGIECKRQDPESGALVDEHVFNQPFEKAFFLIRNFIPMHAALFRHSLLDTSIAFDEQLDFYEDWDFWLQLSRKSGFLHAPGISACYFLGSNSGFGVDQNASRLLDAERHFFTKWQQRWTPAELQLIVDFARLVPDLRQEGHDLHIKMQGLYRDLDAELKRCEQLQGEMQVLQGDKQLLQQQQQRLEAEKAGLERGRRELKAENLELRSAVDLFRSQLEATVNSTSWKLTAPLRRLIIESRNARQALRVLPQRAGTAMRILREEGVAGLQARIRQRQEIQASNAVLPGDSASYQMRQIVPDQFTAVAAQLQLPVTDAPLVSVVIPVYNHLAFTLACLQSLQDNPQQTAFEVIVVDDASTDETRSVLEHCKALRYVRNDSNSGFIHTCNTGAAQARGSYLFILNNDTEVQADWLDPLVATLEKNTRAGIAGCKLVYPSGHLQEAGTTLRADGSVDMVGLNGDPADPRYCEEREVDHCSGAAILIRAELFHRVGGFDARYAPAYFEDCDFSLKVREAGYSVIYQPASVIVHHLSITTAGMSGGKMAQIERNKALYLERWGEVLRDEEKIRLIAFFLPQFHPIPENDAWWGKGFTEWTNVGRAQPLFQEHYQPQRPTDLGYYDLRLPETRAEQARLAHDYGIHGFCYYYYWFDGKRLLEKPLNDILHSGEPDFPFCVCWANENWTRRWDGRESEVLMAQNYNAQSNVQFIHDLLPVLADPRYIRIKGRPLLLIYRAELIPQLSEAIKEWRRITREAGIGEVYLAAVESFSGVQNDLARDFDALVEFPPHGRSVPAQTLPAGLSPEFRGQLYDYPASAANFMQRQDLPATLFRTAMPSWDNTARRQQAAHIYLNSSPHLYYQWLKTLVAQTRYRRRGDERLVFVNAWNEWAEGNHLEPDERYGRDYLEATRNALLD